MKGTGTPRAKQRSEQHLIDAAGHELLRSSLPPQWLLREYRPDYGLDYSLEIFKHSSEAGKRPALYETLGEHLFIQLKTMRRTDARALKIYGRKNVEKQKETLDKTHLVGELQTIRFSLEVSELLTVERMGVGVPVLLVVADLAASKCYFVCLNDYVDKILVPRYRNYAAKKNRTIHVPLLNQVDGVPIGQTAIRWYAKRAKLYAAFQRFVFQDAELDYAWDTSEGMPMARYFAERIEKYDFWEDVEVWPMIARYGAAIRRFLKGENVGLMRVDDKAIEGLAQGDAERIRELKEYLRTDEVRSLWRYLAVLPRNYEDVCREWFLPTGLGYLATYANC